MVVRKKKIIIDGKEVEVDVFDTRLVPGSGREEESIDLLYREEEIEKEIHKVIETIDSIYRKYKKTEKNIWFYYEIGRALQFVDRKGFFRERNLIWERIANNLRPEIFFGKKIPPKKSKRYPEIMYLLAKQKKEDVPRITWSHWFEILQYPRIYKNRKLVGSLVAECELNKLSSERLRKRVQEVNKEL